MKILNSFLNTLKIKIMKEDKIIAFIGIYGSLILGLNFENNILAGLMILQAVIWLWRYAYLVLEKGKH